MNSFDVFVIKGFTVAYLDILVDLSVEDYDYNQGQKELNTEGEQGVAKLENNKKQADNKLRDLFRIEYC